jgi:hypothetical protein
MTHADPSTGSASDRELVAQFVRLFGHAPTATELARYRRARSRVALRLPLRARRGAARLIVRL